MAIKEPENPLDEGLRALGAGNVKHALIFFRRAATEHNTPLVRSYLAYCHARLGGAYHEALAVCMEARKEEPRNSDIYLNLGKIHLLAGNRKQAIQVFQLGLRQRRNPRITAELNSLGIRKTPPFPFLQRSHPLNKYLGIVLTRLWLR